MKIRDFILELSQLPQDYDISICGIEDFSYAIDNKLKVVLVDEETPIDEIVDDNCDYDKFILNDIDSHLIIWAKHELDLLNEDNDEMQNMITDDVIQLLRIFSSQGHSGFSAPYAMQLFKRLVDFKPLTPLTGEDDEWDEVQPYNQDNKNIKEYQNNRYSALFKTVNLDTGDVSVRSLNSDIYSDNGGISWFICPDVADTKITFPYEVPSEPNRHYIKWIDENTMEEIFDNEEIHRMRREYRINMKNNS